VPEELKQERYARFMQKQEAISRAKLARRIGRTLTVLIDKVERSVAVGRSSADAPEIDGVVYVEGGGRLRPGDFCEVAVTGAEAHDLRAVVKAAPADPAAQTP
jgi:ribosomal protein S12 methylthiotransferase